VSCEQDGEDFFPRWRLLNRLTFQFHKELVNQNIRDENVRNSFF